jgi:hypothetical protein
MCEECLKEVLSICVCSHADCSQLPKNVKYSYACICDEIVYTESDDETILHTYAKHYKDNMKSIEACSGCKIADEEKKDDFTKAVKGSIECALFDSQTNNFLGYALDEIFIVACEKSKKISLLQELIM